MSSSAIGAEFRRHAFPRRVAILWLAWPQCERQLTDLVVVIAFESSIRHGLCFSRRPHPRPTLKLLLRRLPYSHPKDGRRTVNSPVDLQRIPQIRMAALIKRTVQSNARLDRQHLSMPIYFSHRLSMHPFLGFSAMNIVLRVHLPQSRFRCPTLLQLSLSFRTGNVRYNTGALADRRMII